MAVSSTPSPTPTAITLVPWFFTAFAENTPFSISRIRVKFPGPSAGWL